MLLDKRKQIRGDQNIQSPKTVLPLKSKRTVVISVGVLGSEPGVAMSKLSGEVVAFALTKEVAGGVDKLDHNAMYSAPVA